MEHLTTIFQQLLSMSLTALPVMAVVLTVRWLLRNAPKKYTYLLWLVVAFRLVCPVTLESPLGFVQAEPASAKISSVSETYIEPTLTFRDNGGFTPDYDILLDRGYTPNDQGEIVTNTADTREAWQVKDLSTFLWLVGMAAMLLWLAVSTLRLKRQVATAVRREENIWECDGIPTPFVLGLLRPRIYLPFRMSEEERTYILAHERYHIRQGDHWAKAAAALILAVYWWNPTVWLCRASFCRDMEMRCDEAVLARLGNSIKQAYSRSLLSFALDRRAPMALAFGEHDASKRIKNVLRWKKARPAGIFLSVTAVILVALICDTNAAKKYTVSFTHCDSGIGVDFTARIPENSRIAAIYQDVYHDGNLVSSFPWVTFGSQRIPASREISGCLRYDVPHGEGGFAGSVNFVFTDRTDSTLPDPLFDASEEWTVTLSHSSYTGSGSCIGDDSDPKEVPLSSYSSVPLLTIVFSDKPNGELTFYQKDTDITELNACTVQFRLVTTPEGVLSSSTASGSTDETTPDNTEPQRSLAEQLCSARNDSERILTLLGARYRLGNRYTLGQNVNHQLAIYYYDSPADPDLRDTLLWKYSMVLLALLDNYTETTWNWIDNGVPAHAQNGGLWNSMDWLAQQNLDGSIRDYGASPDKLQILLDALFPTGIPNIGGDTVLNIPSLTEAAAMTETELLGRIGGCVVADIQYAWGEPNGSLSGFWGDLWEPEDSSRYITVYYDGTGHVRWVRINAAPGSPPVF